MPKKPKPDPEHSSFQRQTEHLRSMLGIAVPLWILQLQELAQQSGPESEYFWRHVQERANVCGQMICEHGDALMFKEKHTAEAFNRLAEGIACLSFAPGGVTTFGAHWETKLETKHAAR